MPLSQAIIIIIIYSGNNKTNMALYNVHNIFKLIINPCIHVCVEYNSILFYTCVKNKEILSPTCEEMVCQGR